jgi:hypothetical protein
MHSRVAWAVIDGGAIGPWSGPIGEGSCPAWGDQDLAEITPLLPPSRAHSANDPARISSMTGPRCTFTLFSAMTSSAAICLFNTPVTTSAKASDVQEPDERVEHDIVGPYTPPEFARGYQRRRAWGSTTLPLLRYPASMPRPHSGRQAEQGRAELPGQIASSQRELDARPPQNKARRERLGWQVENLARGLAYVRERLRALRTEG